MSRPFISEVLRGYAFHLVVIPKGFSVSDILTLVPTVGFSSVSMPQMSVNVDTITEGNMLSAHRIPISVGDIDITLSRGATFLNCDFYNWIIKVVESKVRFRRDIILIQYFPANPVSYFANTVNKVSSMLGGNKVLSDTINSSEIKLSSISPMIARMPVRAWVMTDCFPISYKPGGDLDANSSDLQITELTLAVHSVSEYSGGGAISSLFGL